ncbi:MAG: phenylalanine--tRNA ligase subunit beta [Parvibaculum sp.]
MKFTLSWLKDHLETDASLETIVETLTMVGLEVEGVVDPAAALAPFAVARIVEAVPHPDADKLRLCKVEALVEGKLQTLQVVCGAPNARTGLLGIFAPSGATIPSNGMVLKPTKIRGVESNGMMCSERELELSDEHNGIIELEGEFAVGTPAADALGHNDPVIEIAITPNRPDCLGVYGVARDLAAAGLGTLKTRPALKLSDAFKSPVGIELNFAAGTESACPVFAGRMVKGVKNGPSPKWLRERLTAIGLRPINALVDVTNYISYDQGRPLHVYDAAKLSGNLKARLGKGETFLALDGKEYTADDTMTVIADDACVLGFGGIMGGEESGSTETTVDVFIESAYFDPNRTAATGRKTGIISDARYRFERGIDPASTLEGADRAAAMIMELCGGTVSERVVAGAVPDTREVISFDPARVAKLTGLTLGRDEIQTILSKLGFEVVEASNGLLSVTAPTWRPDIFGSADLVEEVVRIHGLHEVTSTPLPKSAAVASPVLSIGQKRLRTVRRSLAARGFVEAVTWSFIPQTHAALFGGENEVAPLALANPISTDMSHMRPSILPGLVAAAGRNMAKGARDIMLFEAGQHYDGDQPGDQALVAVGIRQGTAGVTGSGRHWQGGAKPVDVFDVKADAVTVLAGLGVKVENLQIAADAPGWYHPGRSGVLRMGPKNVLARFGELHPSVLNALDVAGPIVAFEVLLDAVPTPKAKATKSKPALTIPDLQPVRRDFAFIVAKNMNADVLIRAAAGADKKLIVDVTLFDRFEGGSLGADEKSLAIEVTLQPTEKTLTDDELEAVSTKIVAMVTKATGGRLRG